MGFSKVYKSLQDIFPEIDNRVLRAVALENRKDADAAAEVVLTKVIPHFIARSTHSSSSSHDKGTVQSPKVIESCADVFHGDENPLVENAAWVSEEDHGQSLHVEDGDKLEDSDKICDKLLVTSASEAVKPYLEKEYNDSNTACNTESSIPSILEDDSTLILESSRSSRICCTDVIDYSIAVERNNKKTLFEKMQSVVSLMQSLEVEERAAEQANKEAANGGSEILKRLEEIKEEIQRTKEANDMHSGEVYGEKAILATEVKELQFRILSLSEQRDASLRILDELYQHLERRLDAAKKEKEAAEKSILEKEDLARNALAEKHILLEKVVQEANDLKQLEEENSKLREYLVDRGRVVDMLQAEICLIFKDVELVKQKFDNELLLLCSKRRPSINHSNSDATTTATKSSQVEEEQVIVHAADSLSETAVDKSSSMPVAEPLGDPLSLDDSLPALLDEQSPSLSTAEPLGEPLSLDDSLLALLDKQPPSLSTAEPLGEQLSLDDSFPALLGKPSPSMSVAEPRHDDHKDIEDDEDGWEIC